METTPQARIVSVNQYGEAICAGAARISTTQGNALDIFESAKEGAGNFALIKKVLRSGHCSILEHAVFSIALWNVSAFAEQFFIEFRLASFTVKSRRYVDFGGQGYYVPSGLPEEARGRYCQYMDGLFDAYRRLLALGAPKEDARFLLPYAFHSSFFCTINARQLVRLINAARARGVPELSDLAGQLARQLEALFPNAAALLSEDAAVRPADGGVEDGCVLVTPGEAGKVTLLQAPQQPEKLLETAWRLARPGEGPLEMAALVSSGRPRELEHLNYGFSVEGLSLPALTHLTRHRMQSIVIPPLERIGGGRQLLPESVAGNAQWREVYESALTMAFERREQLSGDPELRRYGFYCLPSATLTSVATTMNARELQLFIRLRSCNRAQWEIRNVALRMLKAVEPSFPALFRHYGPACHTTEECPEGALSCGKPSPRADRS